MDIRRNFDDCRSNARAFTEGNLEENLERLSANTAVSHFKGQCESLFDESILSNELFGLMDDIAEYSLENELILDSLKRSIEARISFEQKFNDKNLVSSSFQKDLINELCRKRDDKATRPNRGTRKLALLSARQQNIESNTCSLQDRAVLNKIVRQQTGRISRLQSPPHIMNSQKVAADLNSRITKLNDILKSYNREKTEQQSLWEREDAENANNRHYRLRQLPRKRIARKKELLRLKKAAFDEYHRVRASLHESGAGNLLQTDVIKNAAKSNELEQISAKWLGLGGFELTVLDEAEEVFPLLDTIDQNICEKWPFFDLFPCFLSWSYQDGRFAIAFSVK